MAKELNNPLQPSAEPFTPFAELIRKKGFPKRSAYGWKDAGLFPIYQIGRIILVKESEVLMALERFRRLGKPAPIPGQPKRTGGPGRPRKILPEATAAK